MISAWHILANKSFINELPASTDQNIYADGKSLLICSLIMQQHFKFITSVSNELQYIGPVELFCFPICVVGVCATCDRNQIDCD